MATTMQRSRERVTSLGPALRSNLNALIAAAAVIVFVVLLFAFDLQQALVIGLINGAMYALIALGLVLVYKSSGIFNFAQGEFGTVAIYIMWLLTQRNIPYVICVILALGCAVVLGLATEQL